jgi:PIN domain nuclease of toxin-antitoxin system
LRAVLVDTHAWAWSLIADDRLSAAATQAISEAARVLVSPISFFEIGQKVRLGKWPEMEPFVGRLPAILTEQRGVAAPLDPAMCVMAGTMAWSHRDPFDRLLAATASCLGCPIVSADAAFDGVVKRIW